MEEDRSKGRRKINEARAKFPCRSVRPSVTIVSTSYIWIKNLSKSYEIRKMHIPRHFLNLSGGNRWGSRDRLDRGKDPPEDVPPVGEFSAEMK